MANRQTKTLQLVLGNQLFSPDNLEPPSKIEIFMAEDFGLCTYERHHQQKLVLFLAAMREYADELREAGYTVHYTQLDPDDDRDYIAKLQSVFDAGDFSELAHFEIEDKPMEQRVVEFANTSGIHRVEHESPMFLCSRSRFAEFARGKRPLRMGDFYKKERLRLGILIEDDAQPAGGQWSFDADNRKKLPKNVDVPTVASAERGPHTADVIELVHKTFPDHPGDAEDFGWPTGRTAAKDSLEDFLAKRFSAFGPYEDAITQRSDTVFHSLLSPLINIGLLTPAAVVERALEFAAAKDVPLQSLEGFVRQLIGWREFVRGIYREFSDEQDNANFWSHERELTDAWYTGDTGIPILDDCIRTAQRLGWTHHIPRLMVIANLMTLCEIRPSSVHRWFMEMYVDSSEWVMGPNVYGMGIFSDGGIFATKPYICGSNYLLKMSDYRRGDWCDVVDGLYWRFIDRHRDFFQSNPRLALMPRALDRLKEEKRSRIFSAAESFLDERTT